MRICLVIIQPAGYIHSLGFLDSARYLRYQFTRLGIETTISKNKPRLDAINIVFGAHLGIPKVWERNFFCVYFNQEQLGLGGALVSPEYIQLLKDSHVIEYDPENLPTYSDQTGDNEHLRLIAPLLNAPYLFDQSTRLRLQDRPIDLLFIGGLNDSRQSLISKIESCGISVSMFDHAMYGPERDRYIRQSKAVLNIPFYQSTRFEQTRVFNALSCGTPVVSLKRKDLQVNRAYTESVSWFDESNIDFFFTRIFKSEDWYILSENQLEAWRKNDSRLTYEAIAEQLRKKFEDGSLSQVWRPEEAKIRFNAEPQIIRQLHLSPERGYQVNWVNAARSRALVPADVAIDVEDLDSSGDTTLLSDSGLVYRLLHNQVSAIWMKFDSNLKGMHEVMHFLFPFLQPNGFFQFDIALGVFEDSNSSINPASLYLEGKIRLAHEEFLHSNLGDLSLSLDDISWHQDHACLSGKQIYFARVRLVKQELTPRQKVLTRMIRDDFGGLPLDNLT